MTTVFLHIRTPGNMNWSNSGRQFLRLPAVGEYVATSTDSDWYKVELVLHCAFEADYAAEVFAVRVDHIKELKAAVASSDAHSLQE